MADAKKLRMDAARKALAEGGGRAIYPRSTPYDINEGFDNVASAVRDNTKARNDNYDRFRQARSLSQATDPLEMLRTYKGISTLDQKNEYAENIANKRKELTDLKKEGRLGPYSNSGDGVDLSDRARLDHLEQMRKSNPSLFEQMTEEEYEQYVRQGNFPNDLARRSYEDNREKIPEYRQQADDLRYAGARYPQTSTPIFMEEEDLELSRLVDRGSSGDVRREMAELAKKEADFTRQTKKATDDLMDSTYGPEAEDQKRQLRDRVKNQILGR